MMCADAIFHSQLDPMNNSLTAEEVRQQLNRAIGIFNQGCPLLSKDIRGAAAKFQEALAIFPYLHGARSNLNYAIGALGPEEASVYRDFLAKISEGDLDFIKSYIDSPDVVYGVPAPVVRGGASYSLYVAFNDFTVSNNIRNSGNLWQADKADFLASLLGDKEVFFDVGAHIGTYAAMVGVLLRSRPRVKIHAFEPFEENFILLQHNCRLNGLGNVVCENLALSDHSGLGRLYAPYVGTANHSLGPGLGKGEHSSIAVSTLDEYCAKKGVMPDLMKLHAQGSEGKILSGGKNSLGRCTILALFYPFGLANAGEEAGARKWRSIIGELEYKAVGLTGRKTIPLTGEIFGAMYDGWKDDPSAFIDILLTR
jgi:FkbM family methyltransferase